MKTGTRIRAGIRRLLFGFVFALLFPALEVQAASTLEVIHAFEGTVDNPRPFGLSHPAGDGWLYGILPGGGTNNGGALFKLKTDGTGYSKFFDFGEYHVGRRPASKLIQLADGRLAGSTSDDEDVIFNGTIYAVMPDGTNPSKLYKFNPYVEGWGPGLNLTLGPGGVIWGTLARDGTLNHGSAFEFRTGTGQLTVLHSFKTLAGDTPQYAPILGLDGGLYGTAMAGPNAGGVIYELDTDGGSYGVIHAFTEGEIWLPVGTLLQGPDGRIYGTTLAGGSGSAGIVYSIRPDGTDFKVLHEFSGGAGGESPTGGVVFGPDGRLYGLTRLGGVGQSGTAYGMRPDGSGFEIIHYFAPESDGGEPSGELVLGPDGRLYGTTPYYGPGGGGTVFAITVGPHSAPELTEGQYAEGVVGKPFYGSVACTGGPTEFSVDGPMPGGISINLTTGQFSGVPTEAGSYLLTITATNDVGSDTEQFQITIAKAKAEVGINDTIRYFDGSPQSVTVYRNPESVMVTVTYDGNPNPPSAIGFYDVVVTVTDPNYEGEAHDTMAIVDPVVVPPTIVEQPASVVVDEGQPVVLTAVVSGSGPISFVWMHDGVPIEGQHGSTLRIENAKPDDVGSYKAWVHNAFEGLFTEAVDVTVLVRTGNDQFYFTTMAGESGNPGSMGGTAAKFNQPIAIAIDPDDNVFVVDSWTHVIRKVTPEGTVTTFAGKAGVSGSTDGTGGDARFYWPAGIAAGPDGTIYVADTFNNLIRKISPEGVVTTLAGSPGEAGSADGTGSGARFYHPCSITVSPTGVLYVADTGSHTIRRISPGGSVVTIAGNPAVRGQFDGVGTGASFGSPIGLVMDSAGNLFVTDSYYQNVRKITPAGVVSHFAGALDFPGNGNVDAQGDNARFTSPWGICIDPSGNLFLADEGNLKIRKISPGREVTTFAGWWTPDDPFNPRGYEYVDAKGADARFESPTGIAMDSHGNFFVVDPISNTIRKITPDGTVTTFSGQKGFPGSDDSDGPKSLFYAPRGLALATNGDVIVADTANYAIRRLKRDGSTTLIGGRIGERTEVNGPLEGVRLFGPDGVAQSPTGDIIIADTAGSRIRKLSPSGVLTTIAGREFGGQLVDGPPDLALFTLPAGVAVGPDGTIYVADTGNNAVRKITIDGVTSTLARDISVAGLAMDKDGNLILAGGPSRIVRKLAPDGTLTTVAGKFFEDGRLDGTAADARFGEIRGVAVDRDGFIYVADTSNHAIRMITPDGVVTTIGGLPGKVGSTEGYRTGALFNRPMSIAVAEDGTLFVADTEDHTIRMGVHVREPRIVVQPVGRRVALGASVTLQATVIGSPEPQLQWRKDGMDIPGATGSSLAIASVATGDYGIYTLVANSSLGSETSAPALLAAPEPVSIVSQPALKSAVVGSNVTFSVDVTGTGPFTFQWRKDGVAIQGATDETFTIANFQPSQAGSYSVLVTNVLGTVTSGAAALSLDTTPRLINVSCRASAGSGGDTLIAGFYISGTGTKDLLIRGVGPRLRDLGVPEVVSDPWINLHDNKGVVIASNDNWDASLAASFAAVGAFLFNDRSKDAAMIVTLGPGLYTVHLVNNGAVGDGLIEVYDVSRDLGTRITNVSSRLHMNSGQTVILGTALIGGPVHVLARNVGPGLAQYLPNPEDVLPDPRLQFFVGSTEIDANDNWDDATGAYFGPTGAFPLTSGSKDAAMRVLLSPGGATFPATDVSGASGVAIIELYESK